MVLSEAAWHVAAAMPSPSHYGQPSSAPTADFAWQVPCGVEQGKLGGP